MTIIYQMMVTKLCMALTECEIIQLSAVYLTLTVDI